MLGPCVEIEVAKPVVRDVVVLVGDSDGLETVECPLETPPVLVRCAGLAEFVVRNCDDWETELERIAPVATWFVAVFRPEAVEMVIVICCDTVCSDAGGGGAGGVEGDCCDGPCFDAGPAAPI